MSFTAPYHARIVTEIAGHVFELRRFHRAIFPADIAFWTEGREDRTWVERPLRDSETDTDRPRVRDLSKPGSVRKAMRFLPCEFASRQAGLEEHRVL